MLQVARTTTCGAGGRKEAVPVIDANRGAYPPLPAPIAQQQSRADASGGSSRAAPLAVHAHNALGAAVLQHTAELLFQLVENPAASKKQPLLVVVGERKSIQRRCARVSREARGGVRGKAINQPSSPSRFFTNSQRIADKLSTKEATPTQKVRPFTAARGWVE